MKKFYAGIALVGLIAALAATGCSNPTGEEAVYSISLDPTGAYAFPEAEAGYAEQGAKTITVANTGNRPTGALAIAASGTNADSFTVSPASINSIAVDETGSFTVAPVPGLAAGTYAATIAVTGGNDISASFDVGFTVNPAADPAYAISLSETGTHIFPPATAGYSTAPEAFSVAVANAGLQATGALTIAASGTDADSFTVSPASLDSIAVDGTGSFTVAPATGLAEGTYAATITVSGENGISAGFDVDFTVNPAVVPAYAISLSETGTHVFPPATAGHSTAPEAFSVAVANAGLQATGALTIAASGTNAGSFTVSPASLESIAAGGTGSFTVAPATGLAAGTYAATITVSGGNGISAGFDVSFTVNPAGTPSYSITLGVTGTYTFPGAFSGYGAQTPKTITVANTGNQPTGALAIAKSGAGANSFTAPTSLGSIAAGGTGSFTVAPATGLAAGTYAATIAVTGGNGISANFDVSFTVTAPAYVISLDTTGTHTFPEAVFGYAAQSAKTITVANGGDQATGGLGITKSGAGANSFTVSPTSLNSIAVGGTGSFTVAPVTGLAAGTYAATITVRGGNNISASLELSFTVNPPAPTYGISLSKTGTHAFPEVWPGYEPQSAQAVAVSNTGNQPTGALTIAASGTNAGSFTVSPTSLDSIAAGGTGSFTVAPNTGLAEGTYAATITVSGGNSISATFDVSFTVKPAGDPTYGIALGGVTGGTHIFPAAVFGYVSQDAKAITVENTGNQPTGALTIAASGTNAGSFTVSETDFSASGIGISARASFKVTPNTGLAVGDYTATITVSGGNGISANFNVSFRVESPVYTISLDQSGTHSFPDAWLGYGEQSAKTVTVSNTGNLPTEALAIAATGANADSFAVTPTSLDSIAVGRTGSFTVAPKTGLAVGTYTATITVTGENGISANFNVSFTVKLLTHTVRGSLANSPETLGGRTFSLSDFSTVRISLKELIPVGEEPDVTYITPGDYVGTVAISGGSYEISGVPAGTYRLTAEDPTGLYDFVDNNVLVPVAASPQTVTKNIALAVFPGLKLTVRIPKVYQDSADPQNGTDIYNGNFILPVRSRQGRMGSNTQTIEVNLNVDWGDGTAPVTLDTVPDTNADPAYTHYYTEALAGAAEKDFVIRIKGTCTTDGTFSEIFGKFGMGYWSVGNPTGVNADQTSGFLRWGHKNKIVKAAGNISALTEGSAVKNYAYQSAFFDCRGLEDISGLVFTDSGDQGHSFLNKAFNQCTALTTIPADLLPRDLSTDTRLYLYETFMDTAITAIPEGFLPEFTTVGPAFLFRAFCGSASGKAPPLSAIPAGFIPTSLTTVGDNFLDQTFMYCENLTTIPGNFTASIREVGYYFLTQTFMYTPSLTAIPAGFLPQQLDGTIGNYFLMGTFGNSGINAIPDNFITGPYGTTGEYFLQGAFSGCTALTTVNLEFIKNLTVDNKYFLIDVFSGCTNVRTVQIPYIDTKKKTQAFGGLLTNTGNPITVYITGASPLLAYKSIGLVDENVAAVYVDTAELAALYASGTAPFTGTFNWNDISDSKFQVRPQE
jgi:uncharacterized membrane protein